MTIGLSDIQKRYLMLTFKHIDESLNNALLPILADTENPFSPYRHDMSRENREKLRQELEHLRARMLNILEAENITLPPPHLSQLWSFQTALLSAKVALEELHPKHMRGYGELAPETAQALEKQLAPLEEQVNRLIAFLDQCMPDSPHKPG